ncbi:17-beta hydroxysteroid dehydrogenase 13 [Pteropus alecto]|uniref:17-beta hydroxysteroid dehydrogenase 13 n=1 Tax=Pteropus alecto TaxID=9402 RepID=L5L037_PTEAL|nr:17-beta hydroxysteroid dehydrogenase 13 [Pteropus alecto]
MNLVLDLLLLLATIIYSYLESLVKIFIPKRKKSVAGEIVLITGAGHGTGRMIAYEFAKQKNKLVLWDINKHGVEETAAKCRKLGATAYAFAVDCSNQEEIYKSVNQVKKEVGNVTIVVNNAGVIYPADLLSTKDEEITKTFKVNILGHFWVGFHRALTLELEALGKTGIKTSCLCPAFVNTGFTKNPSTRLWPLLEPEEVARTLINGILINKKMIFVPSYISTSLILEK